MNRLILFKALIAFLCFASLQALGQITITNNHMPSPGDTIRVSEATYPLESIPDPSITGTGITWDYSGLWPNSQRVLSYVNTNQTPTIFQMIFNSTVANLAMPIEGLDFLDIEVSDAFEFYKNSSNAFVRAGYAANIMGLPVPMKFNQPESIYKFPLSISSAPDSSLSQFVIQYPELVYFSFYKKRTNYVDGSGTLLTPYGSFNTLRVKSVIYERDSLYIDSLQVGVPIIRNITEYKWLSPDYPAPLLTISREGMFYNVQFIDSVRNIVAFTADLGDDLTVCQGEPVTLTPAVEGGVPPYTYIWNTMETTSSITVTPQENTSYMVTVIDDNGNFVIDEIQIIVVPFERISLGNDTILCAEHSMSYNIDGEYNEINWFVNDVLKGSGNSFSIDSTGIGLNSVVLRVDFTQDQCSGSESIDLGFQICDGFGESSILKLSLSPNPAKSYLLISTDRLISDPDVKVYNYAGEIQLTGFKVRNGSILMNVDNLSNGVYLIKLTEDSRVYTAKFVKI